MGILPNARHERFAQELAVGKSSLEAYTIAGYSDNRSCASRLQSNENICKRVSELLQEREQVHSQATAQAIERTALTKEWVIERLTDNALTCMGEKSVTKRVMLKGMKEPVTVEVTDRDPSAANRALELLGKELGMFVERTENLNTNYAVGDQPVSETDWQAEHVTSH